MERVAALLTEYNQTMIDHWKWLHAHPELSGQEEQTAAYVAEQLRRMGLEPQEHVGGHGVTALIQGSKPGKCLGLRADMDALPITEETGVPFASTVPGVMHACGHDAHTAMLLGAAHVLLQLKEELHGSIKLIFQPSEETSNDSGAKRMIADGVLEHPKVDAIIAQHVNSGQPVGSIALRSGPMTAASDRFFITVKGKACHAAFPNKGIDSIVVGAQIITALQSIVARNVSPHDRCVITIGKVSGGASYNTLADTFEMEGTCRTHGAVRDHASARIEQIAAGVAQAMGAECEVRYVHGYSPTVNDPDLFHMVHELAVQLQGEENVSIPANPSMGGEDFSFYSQQVPALFYRLGCHDLDIPYSPAHSSRFIPHEKTLYHGALTMTLAALKYLSRS